MADITEENDNAVVDDAIQRHQIQNSTIFDVCVGGEDNYRILQKMISDNVDVNERKEDGRTPLCVAVCKGDLYAVDALINAGADVEMSDDQLMTPLMWAAELGFDSKLGFLLKSGANPMAVDKIGQTALHKTIRNKTLKCATTLLDHCSEIIHVKDHMEQTALHFAAGEGNDELVDLLIAHGAKVDLADRLGRAPLHWAILQGMVTCAKKIGEHGDVSLLDTQDKLGMRPLHYALQMNHDNISTNLIHQGCDVDAEDIRGQSGLVYASSSGRTDMCGVILENSKNKNSVDRNGWTALHHAAHKDHTKICNFLLDHGIDGNVQNNDGHTAMVLAVIKGNVETVKILCDRVDGWTHIKDEKGRYPIHYAAERGFHEIMEILINALKQKCDTELVVKEVICATDKLGASALKIAALLHFKECCQLLLDNDATIEDNVRTHLISMGLIEEDESKDEEEEGEKKEIENLEEEKKEEKNEENERKEEVLTPRERYVPPSSPLSSSSSDDVKSINLSTSNDFKKKTCLKLILITKESINRSKFRKKEGRKSPYSESLLPPEIFKKYSIGYLPPPNASRLSGRLNSSKSVSSITQAKAKSSTVVVDDSQPCRLKGTLDHTSDLKQSNSRTSNSRKFSYSVSKP
ncbi:serine/threonine-protein phosphatase 6 regulatory ankyrin repeat subunit C-like [Anneissia japonica]|uniref:serine/threonine-protein phosphatase 6 regulatory ankyrin repeat subunit C-like n=1 Tax=Anneissia japonica TaxID=1529436 RepID=UPI0014256246|nr:serine/threonine-protein phosphatase 6 regulatory ankyrin repeat subunit C-like [Anneissia japonica]